MRKVIAALQVSVDGFIEGPNKEIDWIESWEDPFEMLDEIDACVLGGGMYPGYEQYWSAVGRSPDMPLPFTGKAPTDGEIRYAEFAVNTPHYVLSRTLESADWETTRIVRDITEIGDLKNQAGKSIHAVGGATFVSSLIDAQLVDELRLIVHPVILGGGTGLFKDVSERHRLDLLRCDMLEGGQYRVAYSMH